MKSFPSPQRSTAKPSSASARRMKRATRLSSSTTKTRTVQWTENSVRPFISSSRPVNRFEQPLFRWQNPRGTILRKSAADIPISNRQHQAAVIFSRRDSTLALVHSISRISQLAPRSRFPDQRNQHQFAGSSRRRHPPLFHELSYPRKRVRRCRLKNRLHFATPPGAPYRSDGSRQRRWLAERLILLGWPEQPPAFLHLATGWCREWPFLWGLRPSK